VTTPTPGATSAPQPRAIADPEQRIAFDPDSDYWTDVPLVQLDGARVLQIVRGQLDDGTLARVRRNGRWDLELGIRYGVLQNPDVPRPTVVLAAPGETPLDLRVAFEVDLARTFLAFDNLTTGEYLRLVRRHEREIKAAARLGYELLAVNQPTGLLFGKTT
jgi:hypothetical protein